MRKMLDYCRYYVILIAVSSLVGQLYFAMFSFVATSLGISGLGTAILAGDYSVRSRLLSVVSVSLGAISLIAVALHAYQYYSAPHFPGNSYAWPMTGLYGVCVVVLVGNVIRNIPTDNIAE